MILGSIPLLVAAVFTTYYALVWSPTFVEALAFCALLASAFGWFAWLYILEVLPAGVAGMSSLAVPVAGVALAGIQLKEIPTVSESIGMALIVLALCVLSARGVVSGKRERKSEMNWPGEGAPGEGSTGER